MFYMEKIPIGFLLKQLREKKGMSQRQLAIKTGIDRGYVSQIEKGKTSSMTLRILDKWAKGLDMTSSELLDRITMGKADTNEFRSFVLYEYPLLNSEEKSWLQHSINVIRERFKERYKI